ncbi:hypothetical protein EDB83DRAFT_726411 [Lactarius deliciosus]|nr:hypothetical protein EDB83DRAFT_726411 [Lactarius deliciosus]
MPHSWPHYDTFRILLAMAHPHLGHALWDTSPGDLPVGVQVGDVGFVRQGKFHRLFNALCSKYHPSNQRFGVPRDYEQLIPVVPNHIDSGAVNPNNFCSYGVTVTSNPFLTAGPPASGPAEVSFSCTAKRGAVLSLPVAARREDTLVLAHFRQWMVRHINSWYAFSQQQGLGIEMEDIILVTGCHRTRSSANVVFYESRVNLDAQVSLCVQVPGTNDTTFNWQVLNQHTQGAVVSHGPSGEDLLENQCISVRGFRVERPSRIRFSKILRMPRFSIRTFSKTGAATDGKAAELKSDSSRSISETVKNVVSIPSGGTSYQDPLHILLEYIAERAPHCDLVIVHDNDLERLLGARDFSSLESFQPAEVMDYLRRSKPSIGLVYGEHQSIS